MKETNQGRRYTAQFREQAVQLLLQSDKNISQIAQELGVSMPLSNIGKINILDRAARSNGRVKRLLPSSSPNNFSERSPEPGIG